MSESPTESAITGDEAGGATLRRARSNRLGGIAAAVVLVVALLALQPAAVSAQPVACGQVITEDTTLHNDLTECPGAALVIGADGVTLELNGHTVASACEPDVAGPAIDDSGGYDRLRILNGTVRSGGPAAILLEGSTGSSLAGLTAGHCQVAISQPGVGVLLSNSDRNEVERSTLGGGSPSLLLSASDRNEISRSSIVGGIGIHEGDGINIINGSDDNSVVRSTLGAEGRGILILDSTDNRVRGSTVHTYAPPLELASTQRTTISHNNLSGGYPGTPALTTSDSDGAVIRHNQAHEGFLIDGDDARIENNEVDGSSAGGAGIGVWAGDDNLVRKNSVRGGNDGIYVGSAATATIIEHNFARDALESGIRIAAPGTLVRGNTANDNRNFGIEAVPGVIDGGGNRASGNGNPLQCVNVVCR